MGPRPHSEINMRDSRSVMVLLYLLQVLVQVAAATVCAAEGGAVGMDVQLAHWKTGSSLSGAISARTETERLSDQQREEDQISAFISSSDL